MILDTDAAGNCPTIVVVSTVVLTLVLVDGTWEWLTLPCTPDEYLIRLPGEAIEVEEIFFKTARGLNGKIPQHLKPLIIDEEVIALNHDS